MEADATSFRNRYANCAARRPDGCGGTTMTATHTMKVFFAVGLIAAGIAANTAASPLSWRRQRITPLVRVIASPMTFHRKVITTAGFLSLNDEETAIYMSREDYDNAQLWNSVFLRLGLKEINQYYGLRNKYVVVTGTYDADDVTRLFSGSLRDVKVSAMTPGLR